jgi:hypothetical protein
MGEIAVGIHPLLAASAGGVAASVLGDKIKAGSWEISFLSSAWHGADDLWLLANTFRVYGNLMARTANAKGLAGRTATVGRSLTSAITP